MSPRGGLEGVNRWPAPRWARPVPSAGLSRGLRPHRQARANLPLLSETRTPRARRLPGLYPALLGKDAQVSRPRTRTGAARSLDEHSEGRSGTRRGVPVTSVTFLHGPGTECPMTMKTSRLGRPSPRRLRSPPCGPGWAPRRVPWEGPLCCLTRASVQLERGVRIRLHNRGGSLLFGSDLRVIVT